MHVLFPWPHPSNNNEQCASRLHQTPNRGVFFLLWLKLVTFSTNFTTKVHNMQVKIEPSWAEHLAGEFGQPYFKKLTEFVRNEYKNYTCYPPGNQLFTAFDYTPFDQVKVVLLGQDPYHGPGQAHGLCFSVNDGVPHPPSLQNIFREIER